MCAIEAPALAASIAAVAMSYGVTGTWGLLPVVSPAPVTAQVKTTSFCMSISSSNLTRLESNADFCRLNATD